MGILAWIAGLALSGMLGMAAMGKLTGNKMSTDMMQHLGVSESLRRMIGGAEAAAVLGVLAGLILGDDWEWAGLLASVGAVALMIGALIYHRRAGDSSKEMMGAVLVIVLAVLYVLGIAGR